MNKKVKFCVFTLTYTNIMILSAYAIFPFMAVLLAIWGVIFLVIKLRKMDKGLTKSEKIIFNSTFIIYPIIEGIIKYMIVQNIIPYSWLWLNRIEHFASAIGIGVLFFPILKPTLNKLNWLEALIFFVSFIVCIGMCNEFVEYAIRYHYGVHKNSAYYWDTIYDLAINVLGAVVGFLMIIGSTKQRNNYHQKTLISKP